MTQAESVMAALATALGGIGTPVRRSQVVPFERSDLPAIVIRPKNEESSLLGNGLLHCVLDVTVEIHVRGDVPDLLADPVAQAVDGVLRANPTLGGLAVRAIRTAKGWEFADADATAGKLSITYQIHYTEPA